MKRYHVNPKTGNPNICQAKIGFCPFGADEPHYLSKDEARKATENKYNEVYGFFGSPVDEILEMESIVEIADKKNKSVTISSKDLVSSPSELPRIKKREGPSIFSVFRRS